MKLQLRSLKPQKKETLMQESVVNLIHLGHIPEGDYAKPGKAKKGYKRKKKVDGSDPRGFDEIQR